MVYDEWLETPGVSELVPVLSQFQTGQGHMSRVLLLKITETLDPYWFGSGIDLFGYYLSDDKEKRKEEEEQERQRLYRHDEMVEAWFESWAKCVRSDWLDQFANVLMKPPTNWLPDQGFARLFLEVVKRFPDESVQMLAITLIDEKSHSVVAELFRALQDS